MFDTFVKVSRSAMGVCKKCGTDTTGARFCGSCGLVVRASNSQPASLTAPGPATTQPQYQQPQYQQPQYQQPQYQQPQYQQAMYGAPVARQSTNGMAVASLVFSLFCGPLGVIFGHVALGQIGRTGQGGRGLAIAGLVISYASFAVGILIWVNAANSGGF